MGTIRTDRVRTFVLGPGRLFVEALSSLLAATPYAVEEVAHDVGGLAVRVAPDAQPQLIIFESEPPGAPPAELAELRRRFPGCPLVVLTSAADPEHFAGCLEAGVDGYLSTEISKQILLESLQLVLLGQKVFPTALAQWFIDMKRSNGAARPGPTPSRLLSQREVEVLLLLVNGVSNKGIARQLGIVDGTVKTHIRRILRKIGATNRTQAAVWACNQGLVNGKDPHPQA